MDRSFKFVFDAHQNSMRFPLLLPNLPANTTMYHDFKEFLRSRQSNKLPEHRRIEKGKARVKSSNKRGNVALTLKVKDDDFEYCTRKFIHLVNEIYMVFLCEQGRYQYMVEKFDMNLDAM